MNFGELLRFTSAAVNRADREADYPLWINNAVTEIQRRYDWTFMRSADTVVAAAGVKSVPLPDNFKSLQNLRPAVTVTDTLNSLREFPCDVTTEPQLIRKNGAFVFPYPYQYQFRYGYPVFIKWDAGIPSLAFYGDTAAALSFHVRYYGYFPKLVADNDENPITTDFEQMLKAKIKAIAFEDLNDPLSGPNEMLFTEKFNQEKDADARRHTTGRRIQMGG